MRRYKPTEEDGRLALRGHAVEKARFARERYGPTIDFAAVSRMLSDREVVRYPTVIRFEAEPLSPGEFAYPAALGDSPADGFALCVHPYFKDQPEALPLLIAYYIVRINYGGAAAHADAEAFGAALLGLDVDDYYRRLCALADSLPAACSVTDGEG